MKHTPKQIRDFQHMIFIWWEKNRRDLPWRRTKDPYRILVSEVMLQQTQVSRVLPKYAEFLKAFPDVLTLAKSSPAEVLRIWRGMGYNRRALYLKRTAEAVVTEYGGKFPKNEKLLTKLPGLGTYTARALLVFAFKKSVAMVDTNIRQIITHFFFKGASQKEKAIQEVADQLLPAGKSWEWHQALMDYGALELTKFQRSERSRKTSIPFRSSNRFYRGRIIDSLREEKKRERELISDFVKAFGKQQDFYENIIAGLIHDGLVARKGRVLMLPE